jgi:hypothetical protein
MESAPPIHNPDFHSRSKKPPLYYDYSYLLIFILQDITNTVMMGVVAMNTSSSTCPHILKYHPLVSFSLSSFFFVVLLWPSFCVYGVGGGGGACVGSKLIMEEFTKIFLGHLCETCTRKINVYSSFLGHLLCDTFNIHHTRRWNRD